MLSEMESPIIVCVQIETKISSFLFRYFLWPYFLLVCLEDNRKTLVAEPGIFIDALIDSVSNTFLKELNVAYTQYHSESNLNMEEKYVDFMN